MFVTVKAGFSLATYLPLTFKPFKQDIATECYSYNRFQPNKLSISYFRCVKEETVI